ncbi:hypothetical protein PRIPAC_84024 [Pristionchus pacificus]|uniref:Uncharacterized protein n=1 Tax=Pristionchus pacificus TaxID=54126 RepID=A0A2A6BV79_PRIPA|nr:hypothetical protein PRIPAC_84024 [Pristionchus pacificus]|eukprot:PDM69767.1 hypothetical protein PRIPAC_44863 [Pristionchus pacificus]
MNRLLGRKKEVKQEEQEEHKKEEKIDYNNLALDTAPVSNFKKKVAQDLYEPWMDEKRKKSVSIDAPTPNPELKGRSKFAFADDYTKQMSPSLNSIAEEQRRKEDRADRQRLAREQAEIEKQKAKITPQPTHEEWGPIDKKSNKKNKLKHSGVGDALVREPQEGVRTVGAGSSLLFPRATSALNDREDSLPQSATGTSSAAESAREKTLVDNELIML